MKFYRFTVYFVGRGEELVTAGCPSDAIILACANRINKGLHRECYQLVNHDNGDMWGLTGAKTVQINYIK